MKTFLPSELILNPDGSVYHLHLLPQDIGDIILTVGDPDRVSIVSSFFDRIEIRKSKREFVTHTGWFKGKRITVLSTGIGTDNVEIAFHELDALVNIDLGTRTEKKVKTNLTILRLGTSGSLQEDIPVDSLVFSDFGLGLDGLLHFYKFSNDPAELQLLKAFENHYGKKKHVSDPYLFSCHPGLKSLFAEMKSGVTVTCPGFYAPQGRVLRYETAEGDVLEKLMGFNFQGNRITNFEMETSAMFGLGKILDHRVGALNVIVANRIRKEFSKKYEETMQELIRLVLEKITD